MLYYHCHLQIMAERKNAKAMACGSLQGGTNVNLDVPLQGIVCYSLYPRGGPGLDGFSF